MANNKPFTRSTKMLRTPPRSSSCPKCTNVDSPQMVQCRSCKKLFHYECVLTDSEINIQNWNCDDCLRNPRKNPSNQLVDAPPMSSHNITNPSTSTSHNMANTSICQVCAHQDEQSRVQCDKCDLWFHFTCVNVTSDVSNRDWICTECQRKADLARVRPNVSGTVKSLKSKSATSTSSRRKSLALQKLEEEQRLRAQREKEYLEQKYLILEMESSQGSLDSVTDTDKSTRTNEWVESVANAQEDGDNEISRTVNIEEITHAVQMENLNGEENIVNPSTTEAIFECWSRMAINDSYVESISAPKESKDQIQPNVTVVSITSANSVAKTQPVGMVPNTQTCNQRYERKESNVKRISGAFEPRLYSSANGELVEPIKKVNSNANVTSHELVTSKVTIGTTSYPIISNYQPIMSTLPARSDLYGNSRVMQQPVVSNYKQPVASNQHQSSNAKYQCIVSSKQQPVVSNYMQSVASNQHQSSNAKYQSIVSSKQQPVVSNYMQPVASNQLQSSNANYQYIASSNQQPVVSNYHQPEASNYTQPVVSIQQHSFNATQTPNVNNQPPVVPRSTYGFGYQTTNLDYQSLASAPTSYSQPSYSQSMNSQPQPTSSQPFVSQPVYMQPPMNNGQSFNSGRLNQSAVIVNPNPARLTAEQIAARHVMPRELPYFNGDPNEWEAFISAFENSTETCGFSNSENLGRLQKCLKGDARTAVRSRLLHKDSVPGVIQTLRMMYGRPELIIETMIRDVQKMPAPKDDDLATLIKFAVSVQNLSATIQNTGAYEHLRNPMLLNSITDKLPAQIQLNWAFYKHSMGNVNIGHLGEWLYQLADVASQIVRVPSKPKNIEPKNNTSNKSNSSKPNHFLNTHVENSPKGQSKSGTEKKCPACKSDSCTKLVNCKKFKEMPRTERWIVVRNNKLCSKCFGAHKFYRCQSTQSCDINGCKMNHHTMLHNHETDSTTAQKARTNPSDMKTTNANTADPETKTCNSQKTNSQQRTDKFRIVPVMLRSKNKSVRDYAYLDDGSNMTTMEESLANELELHGSPKELCVDWAFGNTHSAMDSKIVTVGISGYYENAPRFQMNNVRTVKHLHLPSQSITTSWIDRYSHLKTVPIATYDSIRPRILIGLQYSKLIVSLETIEGRENEPIVCKTRLGWVVQGPTFKDDEPSEVQAFSVNMCVCQSHDNELYQLVKDYFTMENLGVKISDRVLESKEMQRAKQILDTTTVKKGDRYETGLLWKQDEIELPNSYDMALKRLICLENKMAKNPKLKANLFNQIEQFVDKKYIRKLTSDEIKNCKYRVWYLPTFPVFNPKKPDKVRLVWDGAAKVKKTSLNSYLLAGPDQLVPLPEIIRRFRERAIAMTGDIKEMYHQVQVREEDQHVQRFLWRDNPTKESDVYVMMVMTFGSKCSPSVAQYVKNKNATEFKDKFPRAAEAIIDNHYVDDMIDCTHTVDEADKLVKDVKMIHQVGGFEIRNFTSNSKELLEKIGEKTVHQNKNLNISIELGTERVLGMFWNTATDNFTYSLKFTNVNEKMVSGEYCPTKREVLRILMSVFDPLGLLANFLVYGKILLQEIWRSNIDWDEKLTPPVRAKWIQWIQALPHVETIKIPRLYSMKLSPKLPSSTQMHTFVDASVEACAAVTYLRIEDDEGVDCCLVGAKTKVAPNKPMSVPRLELQAAVLGTRLADNAKNSLTLKFEKHVFWSDSKTVMGWINSEARRYHQFVAFRIGEILDSTTPKDWRWVPTEQNVADEATKSKIQTANSSSRWYKGPKFLYDQESTWFTEDNEDYHYTEEEMRPCFVMACREVTRVQLVEVKRFSKWNRLVRAMAYVYRFLHNAKATDSRKGPLIQEEIIKAENYLYCTAQRDHYLDEIIILKQNAKVHLEKQRSVEKSSELFKLSPYLDDNEVLRIKGRIDAATCLSQDTKRPIILPRRHYITRLIVDHYHRRYKHLNHQTALNEIKQKFDIPALRVVMKEVRNSCQVCKNESATPQIPEMAELPLARLAAFERPFTYVVIDYFGTFKVKITRNSSAKRWGVLFTCLTTRAIHLEVAHSLTTNSCIICVEKFADRFGDPREWYSDNGTNFQGLDNELQEEFHKLNLLEIQERFTNSDMKWFFNPPSSPHMGGAWERLIRTVKNCFKKMVTTRNPTDETLPAIFAAVENIVNSRPLTYVSLESADDEALTPNHFLLGSSNGRKPICRTTPRDLSQNDWKNIQEQTNQFWKRFVLEYMPTLTKRTKWFKDSKPVKVGDVVLIIDERNPRNTYPKGIVEQTFVGKGGKRRQAMVRATLQTKNGTVHKQYRRSVHKLAVLDVKVTANEEVNQLPVESINEGETVGQH